MTGAADWGAYLAGFHAQHPGITEDVLGHAVDAQGLTAYDWAASKVAAGSVVLDLACGSGPMYARLRAATYVGLDLSRAECLAAAARSVPVAQADVLHLPAGDHSVDIVLMSMALMLVPLPATLAEVKRVLRPGGLYVATVPTSRPLPAGDRLRYARLGLALGLVRFAYPNDRQLIRPEGTFAAAGLTLREDNRRAFAYPVTTEHQADQLLTSLYLPNLHPNRFGAGLRVVRGWVGTDMATPIRLFVATA